MTTAFERNVNGRQGKNCWDTSKEVITSLELLQILECFPSRGWCHSEADELSPLPTQARAVVRHGPCSCARGGRLAALLRVGPARLQPSPGRGRAVCPTAVSGWGKWGLGPLGLSRPRPKCVGFPARRREPCKAVTLRGWFGISLEAHSTAISRVWVP